MTLIVLKASSLMNKKWTLFCVRHISPSPNKLSTENQVKKIIKRYDGIYGSAQEEGSVRKKIECFVQLAPSVQPKWLPVAALLATLTLQYNPPPLKKITN